MSISKVFYALIDDRGATFQSAEFHSDYIIFRGHLQKNTKKCLHCQSFKVHIKETKERTFRMVNLRKKRTQLKIDVHKIWCQMCNKKTWIEPPFACGKLPMTLSFIRYIIQLTAMTTLLCVALFLGLQWKTVKNIDKTNLKARAKQFSFKKLRYISIDEIAIKKGHKYMTVFTDISTGQIIHAVEGRSEQDLRPFLKLLAKKAKRLRGIGIDMSAAYASSIKKHLPTVAIIFDRFHVTKLLNNTIDKIRRAEYAKWWIIQAIESEVEQLAKTARMLLAHFEGLLSYFEHKIDNGKAEGINNKIKVLKKQAYGYRRFRTERVSCYVFLNTRNYDATIV